MADNRIYGEFNSYANVNYKIFIYDAEFVSGVVNAPLVMGDETTGDVWGDPSTGNVWGWNALDDLEAVGGLQTLHVAVGGFQLEYETQNENLYTPLMPSKVTWKMFFENEEHETFLNAMANSYEGQFLVRILKQDELFWTGVLIPDVIQFEDQYYPYEFQFTAIDGLSRLKSITYPNAVLVNGTPETILTIILECLSQLETLGFWGALDDYFVDNVNWWELRHVAAYNKDPLALTRFNTGALYEENTTTQEVEFFDCYKMLEQICIVFGARLFQADGRWYFMQVTPYNNSVQPRKVYSKTGVLNTWTGGFAYDLPVDQVNLARAEGQYEYLPPLRSVSVTYKHRSGTGTLLNGITWDFLTDGTVVSVGTVSSNGGVAKLKFQCFLEHTFRTPLVPNPPDPHVQPYADPHFFRIQIKVGLYYLNGSGSFLTGPGFMEWTLTPSFYTYSTTSAFVYQNHLDSIQFITPEIPADGACTISLAYYQTTIFDDTVMGGQYNTVLPLSDTNPTGIAYWVYQSPLLVILAEGSDANTYNFNSYTVTNTNTSNTKKVELVVYFGDGPTATSLPRMETYNGSTWGNSTLWGNGLAAARTQPILSLLVGRIMAAQQYPRIKYVGKLISIRLAPYFPYSRLKINDKYYVFLGGAFNADTDTWEGLHVFHIKTDLDLTPINTPK